MTFAEAIGRYLTLLAAWGKSRSTIVSNRTALTQLALWLEQTKGRACIRVGDVAPEDLRAFQAHLYAYRYRRSKAQDAPERSLSTSTRYNRLDHVRLFFSWLAKEGIALVDPASALELGPCGRGLPASVLTEDEAARLLSAPPQTVLGIRDRAVLELFYSSGLRRAELSGLDLGDVDLGDGVVFVRRGKGGKPRVVPLGKRAEAAIARYLKESRPHLATGPSSALFLGAKGLGRGRRLKGCGIADLVRQAADAAGIERHVTPHTLRHSFATHLLRGGAGIRHVQEMLGHSRIDTTEVYTHVAIPDLKGVHARCHPRGRPRDGHG